MKINNYEHGDPAIEQTKAFLKQAFQENPHFSFNDWKIIYNHSVRVYEFAMEIAEAVENVDKELLVLAALLHDIGKTYKADEETLRRHHAELSYVVSKDFIQSLSLSAEQQTKLKEILEERGNSLELQVLKDADIITFYADPILYTAFKNWALERGFKEEIERKLQKINQLHFEVSKKTAPEFVEEVKRVYSY